MDALNQKFSEWLENLQRESWNLELIISGFSIFLLFQANESLQDLIGHIQLHFDLGNVGSALAVSVIGTLIIGTGALILNLIIHITLRGIWIGTIGLRSVQQKIDYQRLNYSDFFTKKLQQRLTNLDTLITRLDTLCSVIFAFTFLVFFMFFSFAIFFAWSVSFQQIGMWLGLAEGSTKIVLIILVVLFNLAGILYFIDTFTAGFLKKFHWTSKLYFPIYQVFTLITLSFIYRTIYYTFLSRYHKSHFGLFLFLYIFIIFNIPFFRFNQNIFFPDNTDTEVYYYRNHYDNLRKADEPILWASIPTDRVQQQYVSLFINYQVSNNDAIRRLCIDYEPSKKKSLISGIRFENGIQISEPKVDEANPVALLNCLSQTYQIYLNDSLLIQPQFFYFRHPNQDEHGIRTMIDTKDLSAGQHQIIIKQWELEQDSLVIQNYATLSFWLEK